MDKTAGVQGRATGMRIAAVLLVCVLASPATVPWAGAPPLVIVLSREIRPYVAAADALEEAMAGRAAARLYVEDVPARLYDAMEEWGRKGALFVAVGPGALNAVSRQVPPPPTTALMIADPTPWPASAAASLSAVILAIPLERQLERLHSLFPHVKTVAVPLSDPAQGAVARPTLSQVGIMVHPLMLPNPADWTTALVQALDAVDAVLFVPDPALRSLAVIRYVTAQCLLRKKIPIGYNQAFHEAGAAVSFIVDPEAVGREGARLVQAMAEGHGGLRADTPYRIWVKERIVRHLGLPLPDPLPPWAEVHP